MVQPGMCCLDRLTSQLKTCRQNHTAAQAVNPHPKPSAGQGCREDPPGNRKQGVTATIGEYGSEVPLIKDNHNKLITYQKLHFTKNNLSLKMFNHTVYTDCFPFGVHYALKS